MNEGGKQPELKAARLTGRTVDAAGTIMWGCQCPECNGTQWAMPKKWKCIYCGAEMSVRLLHPVISPDSSSERTEPLKE